jgi:RHS repeat-associated protein
MSMTATINGAAKNQAFSYDNVGRLLTATGSGWQRRFAYDRWGNRTGVWNAVTGGTQIQSVSLQQPGGVTNNRIASVGGVNYVYDNGGAGTGNVTSDGAHSYQYDGESRLVKVDSGTTAINTYDAANRRVKKVSAAGTTWYVWEGGAVIAEYGAAPVGASNIRYYHPDRLSTRMITDGSGAVVGTQDHLPFGEDAGVVGENEKHRFTNYERDAESGTDYAVNRQYSNNTGRFLRPDPVAGTIGNPQSLNRYAYSLNDPINLADPLGLQSFCFGYHVFFVDVNRSTGEQVGPVRYGGFIATFCVNIPDDLLKNARFKIRLIIPSDQKTKQGELRECGKFGVEITVEKVPENQLGEVYVDSVHSNTFDLGEKGLPSVIRRVGEAKYERKGNKVIYSATFQVGNIISGGGTANLGIDATLPRDSGSKSDTITIGNTTQELLRITDLNNGSSRNREKR